MRLHIGESFANYKDRVCKWHRWFAWHPVFVATGDTRWLEVVERRREYVSRLCGPGEWRYRAADKSSEAK